MAWIGSILLVVAVIGAASAILALMVSHLRYRKLILGLWDQAGDTLSPAGAAWLLTDILRKESPVLLAVLPDDSGLVEALFRQLPDKVRAGDRVWKLDNGAVWLLLDAPVANVTAVAERLRGWLEEVHPGQGGRLIRVEPPEDLSKRSALFMPGPDSANESGAWRIEPGSWPVDEEEPPAESPILDPLTGTLKSEHAPRAFRTALASRKLRSQPLSLVRLDVDRLKEYNQGPGGRELGDLILRETARVVMASCRETDPVARLEEDEFLVWMPVPSDQALPAVRRLCDAVRGAEVEMGGDVYRFTVTAGIAAFPAHGQNPGALVESAGLAQLSAKRRGRGNVAVFDPTMRSPERNGRDRPRPTEEF